MATSDLFAQVLETPAVQSLARRLEHGGVLACSGIAAAAQPFLAAVLCRQFPNRAIVVVADGLKTQESFEQDINTWLQVAGCKLQVESRVPSPKSTISGSQPSTPSPQLLFYPSWEILPHEDRLPHSDVISDRLETLIALEKESSVQSSESRVLVTSVVALLQRTFRREALRIRTRAIARGDRLDPLDFVEWLEDQGYEPEAQVTQKGEIALRGGILDIYPITSPWPVRMEFFGDELESLRYFDPLTQISREEINGVTMPPAGELGILKKEERRTEKEEGDGQKSEVRGQKSEISDQSTESNSGSLGTLLDYLPKETIVLVCEPEVIQERAEEYEREIPEGDPFFVSWDEFQQSATAKGMTILRATEAESESNGLGRIPPDPDALPEGEGIPQRFADEPPHLPRPVIRAPHSLTGDEESSERAYPTLSPRPSTLDPLHFQSLDPYRPLTERAAEPPVAEAQRREFFAQLHRWLRQGYAVHVFCNNDGEQQRFTEIWRELVAADSGLGTQDSGPGTHLGSLARGFLYEEGKLVVVTDAEIFGRYKVQRPRRLKSPHAQATRSALDIDFSDLEESDYVVHLQHGIGRYLGLQVLPIGSGTKPLDGAGPTNAGQECLVIEYAPNDPSQPPPKLYVPVTEAHLVSKYVGTGKARPPLNTLGGHRWAKAKAHAERAVRDIASEMLAIQAARESQLGHAFTLDTPWQREFEGAFIFEETPDQMRAIVETKADMERPKPMDRLICGDVGFGKTEVGIRAAFKAVMDGRQVAVLVPTTVLAQQHYNTFRERMADYPVRIELLSRFRSRRAQQQVVRDLVAGSVDIVIGTHRLLQDDIGFKDLGLVVIDEEQRFGVLHKEKFKMLRRLVDVLTLSATPIPRTLYLALTGARDMSTIQTPPHDRLPVETIVTQYDERLIRDAIQRELNRGGQVFFLHNRVMTIETMAQKLRALLPRARLIVGHGQMHSDELEEVMTKFVNGEADVLLSTTIIESGLDIPNANTIIIDRADRFGLSDLYQLRGRVGRYKHQAYAYLLLPRHAGLLADVRKRLSAIKQYSTLGSGFKIAMRDLEIRGAGNLLGAEQSGHITAVGFELYCQLLKQSVASLKGEKVKPRVEVQVTLDFLALSPGGESVQYSVSSIQLSEADEDTTRNTQHAAPHAPHAPTLHAPRSATSSAYIPFSYISDPRQRIEIYRKLAQATDKAAVQGLQKELRDRFGPLPPELELLLQLADVRILASERGISVLEVKDDRLMLTRNGDYIMVGSKFPRLTKKDAPGRLKEIKKLLTAL